MSVFRVGQRVRIVRAGLKPALVGTKATIVEHYPSDERELYWAVRADVNGITYASKSHWIEPLIPPSNAIVAWDACAWQPEHLRAPA